MMSSFIPIPEVSDREVEPAANPDVPPVVHQGSGSFRDHGIDGSLSLQRPSGNVTLPCWQV